MSDAEAFGLPIDGSGSGDLPYDGRNVYPYISKHNPNFPNFPYASDDTDMLEGSGMYPPYEGSGSHQPQPDWTSKLYS